MAAQKQEGLATRWPSPLEGTDVGVRAPFILLIVIGDEQRQDGHFFWGEGAVSCDE